MGRRTLLVRGGVVSMVGILERRLSHGRLTYSRRTEKANTTIAFNPILMRRDHTSNSEMLKMNTSNAIAVVSTPLHRLHYRDIEVSKAIR